MNMCTLLLSATISLSALPPTEHDDTEVVTNAAIPAARADTQVFSFRIELDATPSNCVTGHCGFPDSKERNFPLDFARNSRYNYQLLKKRKTWPGTRRRSRACGRRPEGRRKVRTAERPQRRLNGRPGGVQVVRRGEAAGEGAQARGGG